LRLSSLFGQADENTSSRPLFDNKSIPASVQKASIICVLRAFHPPVGLSSLEQTIIARIKRAKLFIFLRDHRHELFDDAFQEELATLYPRSSRGHPPLPPAQLALATIIQAYMGVSDDEVRERDAHGSKLPIGAQLPGYRASTVQHRNILGRPAR
jgi:transposase